MWKKGILNLLSGILGTIPPPAEIVPRSTGFLGRCKGDCSFFPCDVGLECRTRQVGDLVPGCILTDDLLQSDHAFCVVSLGEGGGDGNTDETNSPASDIPSDAPSDVPTQVPIPAPTFAPSRAATQMPMTQQLTQVPTSGGTQPYTSAPTVTRNVQTSSPTATRVITPTNLLGVCQGGCFVDTDCAQGLVCYQRAPLRGVPGCVLNQQQTDGRANFCIPDPNVSSNYDYGGVVATMGTTGQLTECQGECFTDIDCTGGLVCYQRGGSDSAPGCSLGTDMLASEVNLCIKNPTSAIQNNFPSDTSVFALKLYWEVGYDWQFESFERLYCLNCSGNCEAGAQMAVTNCFDSARMWTLTSQSSDGSALIKLRDFDLCIEWTEEFDSPPVATFLAPCDGSNSAQRFWPSEGGSFDDARFEISPWSRRGMCLTQEHHPMTNEIVYFDYCIRPQLSDTSFWNKWFP